MANVFVVDDSPGVLKQIQHVLETCLVGLSILTASEGQEAIEALRASTETLEPNYFIRSPAPHPRNSRRDL